MHTIVIDPGHGGSSKVGGSSPNNATGPNGLLEKDLTFDIAVRVRNALAEDGNVAQVLFTRDGDTNLGLADRAHVARDNQATVFLSIHFNGFSDTNVDGTEVWISSSTPTGQSRQLADNILREVVAVTGVNNRGVKQKDFGVLLPSRHHADTSAALLEVAFLTNLAQAGRLTNTAYRDQIAQAIAMGIHQTVAPLQPVAQSYSYGNYGQSYNAHRSYNGYNNGYGSALAEIRADFSSARSLSDFARILLDAFNRDLKFRQGIQDPTFFPHSSICHIQRRSSSGGNMGAGTGFYIAPNRILTAAHVVEGNPASLDITPGRAHNMSTYPTFSVSSSDWVIHPTRATNTNIGQYDLAVIKVRQAPPHDVFPLEELRMSPMSGIAVCGYAASSDVHPHQQNIDVDTIRQLNTETFTYGLHTRGGTSGSPVFYTDGNRVLAVGVHTNAFNDHENLGCRLTEAKIRWIRSV